MAELWEVGIVVDLCHVIALPGGGENANGHHAQCAKVTVCRVNVLRPCAPTTRLYDRCRAKICTF